MTERTGAAVVEQADDNSILNTEPAVATGVIVGAIGAIGAVAVIGGWIDQSAADELKKQAGIIVPSIFIIAGIVQGLLTRLRAYAPRTAAKIAIANATAPAGAPPTLAPPP
jgi:hypothetical protein